MKRSKKRISLILAIAMLFSVLQIPAVAAAPGAEAIERSPEIAAAAKSADSTDKSTVILACSDVQEPTNSWLFSTGNYTKQNQLLTNIMSQVKKTYPAVNAFFCGGDYNFDITRAGSNYVEKGQQKTYTEQTAKARTQQDAAILTDTVKNLFPEVKDDQITLIQGNHDAFCDALTPTGGYDKGNYSVYVINEQDYPSNCTAGQRDLCQKTADGLRAFLEKLVWADYEKPVFILSHVPLHFSSRTMRNGDAQYAQFLYDAVSCYGDSLNIIFLYGHDHAHGDDDYLGGASVFLTRGDKLAIAQAGNTSTSAVLNKTLNFTYMNYGFVGYFWDQWDSTSGKINNNVDHALTMTSFEISGGDVTIRRFDENGQHLLKAAGGKSLGLNANPDPVAVNTDTYASPQTVKSPKSSFEAPEQEASEQEENAAAKTFTDTAANVSVETSSGKSVSVVKNTNVPAMAKAGVTDYLAFDITVDGFIAGTTAKVTMPSKPGYNKVWYVKDNGELEVIKDAVFNGDTVTFTTNHFSTYVDGIGEIPLDDGAWYFVETPSSELQPGDQVIILADDGEHIMYSQEDYYIFGDPLYDPSYDYYFLKDYSEAPVQYDGKTYYLYNQTLQRNVEANGYLMTVTDGRGLKNCNNKYLNMAKNDAEFDASSAAIITANNTIIYTPNDHQTYYLVYPGYEDEWGVYFSRSTSSTGSQLSFWRLEQFTAPSPVEPTEPTDPEEGVELTEFTKTATATDTENYFDIELNVKAPVEEVYPAVVLLIDVSSSMTEQCAVCGLPRAAGTTVHASNGKYNVTHWDGTTEAMLATRDGIPEHEWSQRMPLAKASAKMFVDNLNTSGDYDHCYVKVITFADTIVYSGDWVDVKDSAARNNLKTTIEGLGTSSGTNVAAGMKASYDALTGSGLPQNCATDNSYLVLLSDGAANKKSGGSEHPCGDNNEGLDPDYIAAWFDTWRTNYQNFTEGPYAKDEDDPTKDRNTAVYMGPVWYADQMHENGINIYSVVLGNSLDCGSSHNNNWRYLPDIGIDNDDFVDSFSNIHGHADTQSELNNFYLSLVPTITTVVKDITVTDPMADNIEFMYFVDANGNQIITPTGVSFNSTTKTITWELPESVYENTLRYRIRVQNENFTTTAETQDILTNGTTRATYNVVVNGVTTPKYQDAVVPTVDTYEGTLEFDKIDQFGNALEGVEFTLTLDEDCCDYDEDYNGVGTDNHVWSATAESDEDGHVVFAHIPSGHTFTLTETKNPYFEEGDTLPTIDCGATVAYGVTTKTGDDWEEDKIVNEVPVFYVVHHAVHVNPGAEVREDAYYKDFVDIIPMTALKETDGLFDLTQPLEGYYDGIREGYIYGGMYEGIRENEDHDATDTTVPENDYDTPDENGWCGKELEPEAWNYYYLREVSEEFLQPRIISVRRYNADKHVERYLLTAIDEDGADNGFYSEYGFIYDPHCDEENLDDYMQAGDVSTDDDEEIYAESVDEDSADYSDMSRILYEYLDVYKNNVKQTTYEQTTVFSRSAGYSHITDDDYFGCLPYDREFVENEENECAGTKTANGDSFKYDFHYTPYYVTSDGVFVSGIYERYTDISDAAKTTAATNHDEKLASGSLTYCYRKSVSMCPLLVKACFAANPDAIKTTEPETPEAPEITKITVTVHANGETSMVSNEAGDFTALLKAPEFDGLRFAGWYADEDFTAAANLFDVSEDTDVYARYINADYFTVKMINTTSKKVITKTRVITVVDDRDNYQEVGLEITVGSEKAIYTLTKDYACVNGYRPLELYSNVDKHSQMIYQDVKLNKVADGTELSFVPYYVTADGSRVYGESRNVIYYADHMENIGG